jgi:hypothetical protein
MNRHNPLFRYLLPGATTLLAVALVFTVYHAWASPDNVPHAGPAAQGGIPGVVSYQGYLTNAAGQPLNATVDVTFRLYSVPTGGTELWTEAHTGSANAVPVHGGQFSVFLGSLTPITAAVWSNSTLYLGVQVDGDAEMTPREVVGAVPAAMTVPDGAITQAKLGADVSVVPPDDSITTEKLADGAASSRKVHLTSASRRSTTDLRPMALSAVYQDIDGTSASIDLPSDQTLIVYGVFDFEAQKAGTLTGALAVDGAESDTTAILKAADGTRATVAQVWSVDLAAGTHVLKLRARSASGSGAQVWRGSTAMTYVAFSK